MGISYSAVKTKIPEAWEVGKDYYGLTDLFPPCAMDRGEGFFGALMAKAATPKLSDLPHLVGSRHIVGNAVFVVRDFYETAEEMLAKIIQLKQRGLDASTIEHLGGFFEWAGDDPIQFIADFDYLEERDAEGEYELCCPPADYLLMDTWNGEAGRRVGDLWDDLEEDEEE
jgi:hypothetical protein